MEEASVINPEHQQKVADLMRACQSVLGSLDQPATHYAVTNQTKYKVSAHSLWAMGEALAALQEDVKIVYSAKDSNHD